MGTWGHDARAANSLHGRRRSCLNRILAAQLSQQTEGVELKMPQDEISSLASHTSRVPWLQWGGHPVTQPGLFRTNIFTPQPECLQQHKESRIWCLLSTPGTAQSEKQSSNKSKISFYIVNTPPHYAPLRQRKVLLLLSQIFNTKMLVSQPQS